MPKRTTDELDAVPPAVKKQIADLVTLGPKSLEGVAAVIDGTESEAKAFLSQYEPEIARAELLADMKGTGNVTKAQRIVSVLLDRIEKQAETADGFDALELIKPALRLVEISERAKQNERGEDLPIFNVVINNGSVSVTSVPKDKPAPAHEVTDVAYREPTAQRVAGGGDD